MRKLYIYLSMIAGMLFMLTLGTHAQKPIFKAESGKTIYAAVAADPNGYFTSAKKGGIVSFNSENPYTDPVNRLCEEDQMILAGAMVKSAQGNIYYGMYADAQGTPTDFCAVDFSTGKKTRLGAASNLTTMYFDEKAGVLCGFGLTSEGKSKLYTIDPANGNLALKADFSVSVANAGKIVAACVQGDFLAAINSNGRYLTLFPNETPARVNDRGGLKANTPGSPAVTVEEVGQSLISDGSTLYWLGQGKLSKNATSASFFSKINTVTLEVTKQGDADKSFGQGKIRLTGMCLDMTTLDVKEPEVLEDFYFSIIADNSGFEGGLLKSNLADPYNPTDIAKYDNTADLLGFSAAAMAEGVYYAWRGENYSSLTGEDLVSVNLETGEITSIAKVSNYLMSMAYDAKNKIMYGVEVAMGEVENPDPLIKEEAQNKSIVYKINLTTGELTKVREFQTSLVGIVVAKDGTMYGLGETALYTLNLQDGTFTEVMSLGSTKPDMNYGQSLVFLKNKLYWLANGYYNGSGSPSAWLTEINLSEKTLAKVGGSNGEFKASSVNYTGLYIVPKMKKAKMISKISQFNDGATSASSVKTYFYNEDNLLMRVFGQAVGTGGNENIMFPMSYMTYKYNDKKQLVETFSRSYRQVDMQTKWLAPDDSVRYTYDEKGNLTKLENINKRNYITYEWDAAGNKTKETKMQNNGQWYELYTSVFSDFLPGGKNCPQKVATDGTYGNTFTGNYTYDDQYRTTSYTTYKEDGAPKSKNEYVYNEEGRLIKELIYRPQGSEFALFSTTNYTNEDEYNIKKKNTDVMFYDIETSADFEGYTSPINLQIKNVSTPTSPNTFELTCDVPESTMIATPAWDVYRDGVLMGRVTSLDENGKIKFIDKDVSNDVLHDWFVQTVDPTNNQGYNISNTVSMENIYTELVPVTNAQYLSYETIEIKPEMGSPYTGNVVTFSWTAPVTQLPILGYNVYVGKMTRADNGFELITDTRGTAKFGAVENPDAWLNTVTIEAVYTIGIIKSAPFTFNLSSIENNNLSSLIEFGDRELVINGDYTSLDMYNTSGANVMSVSGVRNVDLSSLPAGIYMIRVNQDGKISTLKTIVK